MTSLFITFKWYSLCVVWIKWRLAPNDLFICKSVSISMRKSSWKTKFCQLWCTYTHICEKIKEQNKFMLIKIEWQLEPRFYRQIMRENSFKQTIKFGSMCCGKRQNDEPKYSFAMCSIRYLYAIYTDLKCFSHRATYYATSRIQNLLKIASFFKNKEKTVICSNSNNHGAAFHRHCPRIKYIKLFFIRFIIVLRFLFNYTIRSNYLTPT